MEICEKCKSSMVIIKSNTGAKHCMNCGWCSDDNLYKKIQTNADKIRSMNDEELAEYIFGVSIGNAPCVLCSEECDFCELSDEQCKEKTLQWLQSEAE